MTKDELTEKVKELEQQVADLELANAQKQKQLNEVASAQVALGQKLELIRVRYNDAVRGKVAGIHVRPSTAEALRVHLFGAA